MFHAANDTIGIDKVRRNETTIAQYILISLHEMSTSILRKPTSMLHRRTRSNIIIYPSIKQYRNDQVINSYRALQYFQKLPLGKRPKH